MTWSTSTATDPSASAATRAAVDLPAPMKPIMATDAVTDSVGGRQLQLGGHPIRSR